MTGVTVSINFRKDDNRGDREDPGQYMSIWRKRRYISGDDIIVEKAVNRTENTIN